MPASAALFGQNFNSLGNFGGFHRLAVMPSMTYLPTRSALALDARFPSSYPLRASQPVRTRRLGRVGGIPSRLRQFLFQLSDFFLLLRDPFPGLLQISL